MPEPVDVEPKDRRTNEWKMWRARQDVTPSVTATPAVAPAPALASSDVAFIDDALAQMLLKGGAGKPEKAYSDVRSVLSVKHILEDAAGLVPSGRISLPHWDTLGRERDTGALFKPGENQQVVDGLAQRAVPANPRTAVARPTITAPDGTPIKFSRTKLDEPDVVAQFVTPGGESAE